MDVAHSPDPFPDVRPPSFSISLPDNSTQPVIEVIAHDSAVYTANQTMEDFAEGLARSALLDASMGAVGDRQVYGNPSGLRLLEECESKYLLPYTVTWLFTYSGGYLVRGCSSIYCMDKAYRSDRPVEQDL
jgi:hypothetical protein